MAPLLGLFVSGNISKRVTHTDTSTWQDLKQQALGRYFSGLNDMQRQAVFQTEGPLLILAGAGSGKTTVLISRIENMIRFGDAFCCDSTPSSDADAQLVRDYCENGGSDPEALSRILGHGCIRPWNILAITFTNKAAAELRARLQSKLGKDAADVNASTFHSMCVRILRRDIEKLGYASNFTIYDTDDSLRLIKDGLKSENIDEKLLAPRAVLSAISRAKDTMQTPQMLLEAAGVDFREQCVAKVYSYYQHMLKSANALDFDDIIVNTVRLFQQSPETLEYYQNRFRYIMVDEYQDTNHTQYLLVTMLANRHRNICVVGDDDQSIYKFRGATIENILSFEDQFENTAVIRLEQNYRSTSNILGAANGVIANNTERKGKNLWTEIPGGEKVRFLRLGDENEEARLVAEEILDHVKNGAKFSDHAVLYRMNAQSNNIEKILARSAIPYKIVGGLRFYERKEIKDAVAYLSVINNTSDSLRLLRIINEPKRGIGASTMASAQEISSQTGDELFTVISRADEYVSLSKKSAALMGFSRMLVDFIEQADTLPLDILLDKVLEDTGYLASLKLQGFEGESRIENLMELKTNIVKYMQENPESTLAGFLEEISLYTDLDSYEPDADNVVLMTIHSAKGLEFPQVFIIGMDEGIFPGRASIANPDEVEEERRLAYVAITRAKERLSILSAERRLIFGQTVYNRPSRFVQEIPADFVDIQDRTKLSRPAAAAPPAARKSISSDISVGIARGGKPTEKNAYVPDIKDRVRHTTFGEGTVLAAKPMGNDILLEIAFDVAGAKKLMANYAKLVKI